MIATFNVGPKVLTFGKTKPVFTVWTNTDLTEGRGTEYPRHICETYETAVRLSKGSYVQGTNGRITEETAVRVEGLGWYAPVFIVPENDEDRKFRLEREALEAHLSKKNEVLKKAKALGLTDEELKLLGEE